jgi:uncharacterized protein with NRDE domain
LHAGISNGLLQEWPKVQKCRQALANVLELPHPSPPAAAQQQQQQAATQEQQLPDKAQPAAAAAPADAETASETAADNANGILPASDATAGTSAAAPEEDGKPSSEQAADAAAVAAAEAAAAADEDLPWPVLFHHVMGDSQLVPPEQAVPLTGVGEQLDRRLSSVFIEPFEMQVGRVTFWCILTGGMLTGVER